MQGLFSKRLRKALSAKTILYPSFSRILRKRLAMTCSDYNESSGPFEECSDTKDEAIHALKKAYGKDSLRVQDERTGRDRDASSFEDFLVFAYPHNVLDALEGFYRLLPDDKKHRFQVELNSVLTEENSPWIMSDGRMYMVDSRFLNALKDQVEEEMMREGFLGAHEEFRDARSHLQAGDADDAIHKANCAFESALKSLLNQKEGTADELLKRMRDETDLLDGVPDEAQKAIISKVLQGLPVLRHKLAGHGQGTEPVEVPRAFGDLAVNLAATYIKFLLELKRELVPPKEADAASVDGEEFPF